MFSSTEVLQPGKEVSAAPFSLAGHRDRGDDPHSLDPSRVEEMLTFLPKSEGRADSHNI